ncbi:MAG: hypothetical protein MZV64_37835 [Ignavibacteriales bacterium]|nr:hypothetical protein [Ignavibacteriales bacterium]
MMAKIVLELLTIRLETNLEVKPVLKLKFLFSRTGVEDLIEYEITRDKIPLYSVDARLDAQR